MGSSKRNRIMLKLFLVLSFLIILAEIGAIVTISILKSNSSELIDQSWKEMNQKSKSLIQEQLVCCSLSGPGELSPQDIDASCYHREPLSSLQNGNEARTLNQSSCRESIQNWFHDNRYLILAVFAGIFSYQIITMLLTSSAISYAKRGGGDDDSLEGLDSGSHHHHHGATYMWSVKMGTELRNTVNVATTTTIKDNK